MSIYSGFCSQTVVPLLLDKHKVSCQTSYNYLRFYIDDMLKDSITGDTDWASKEYTIPACDICSKSLLAGRSKSSGPVIWIIAVVGRYIPR